MAARYARQPREIVMGIGPWEIAGIVVIVLVIFGAGRLAGVGKALGQGVREFREEARNPSSEDEDELADSDEEKAADEPVASSGSSNGSEAGRKADGQDGA